MGVGVGLALELGLGLGYVFRVCEELVLGYWVRVRGDKKGKGSW